MSSIGGSDLIGLAALGATGDEAAGAEAAGVGSTEVGATSDEADESGVEDDGIEDDGIGAGGIGVGAVLVGNGAGSGVAVGRLCSAIGVGVIRGADASAASCDGTVEEASSVDTVSSSRTDSHASEGSRLLREPAGGTMQPYRHGMTPA